MPVAETPPIQRIREKQEAAKAHWSAIVREGILHWLRSHPPEVFHADELEALGIPGEHRNLIGSQIAKLVNQQWIVECGRRKSRIASRNGAKSNEYRLTELGRDRIVGVGGGGIDEVPHPSSGLGSSLHSGDSPGAGVPNPQGPEGSPSSPTGTSPGTPDLRPARLFEEPSPRPLSPLTDAEAA